MSRLFILFLFLNLSQALAQNANTLKIVYSNVDTSTAVFDYFNNEMDSMFCEYGRVVLLDCSEYWFENTKPQYTTKETIYNNGYGRKEIFIDGDLLFSYELFQGRVNGVGKIWFPKKNIVAYQGYFSDDLLHGNLYCMDESGIIFEMFFKNGCPRKISFLYNVENSSKNMRKVNSRKMFKHCRSNGLVLYPFKER
jgi:antitoxin component YwqK of YwqJK toxin-antitoxin module